MATPTVRSRTQGISSSPACAACSLRLAQAFHWLRASVPGRSLALLIVAAAVGIAGMDERLISTPSAASHILGRRLQHRDFHAGARSSLASDPMGIQAARGLLLAETLGSSSSKGSVDSPWGKINSGCTPGMSRPLASSKSSLPRTERCRHHPPLSQPLANDYEIARRYEHVEDLASLDFSNLLCTCCSNHTVFPTSTGSAHMRCAVGDF